MIILKECDESAARGVSFRLEKLNNNKTKMEAGSM
jgi:hypothetical protein